MEFIGKAPVLNRDFSTGTYTISFQIKNAAPVLNGYDAIKELEELDIRVVKHRQKRSLDANAYAWVLISKLADALLTSKEEVYEQMLRRYGVLYEDESGYLTVTVRSTVDMDRIKGHWYLLKDNGSYKAYAMIKGSSEYDTQEMSHFIDGIVSEAKELDIETLPPRELEEMKAGWKP